MQCPKCKHEMGKKHGRYQYRESGLDNVWLEDWPMFVCPNCKTKLPLLPDPEETAKTITRDLVLEKGRLDGDSIVFLRKAMGLTAEALAAMLGVERGTVSRWENNKQKIEGLYDFRLRLQAIDQILPKRVRAELRANVSLILQHTYSHETPVGELTIQVPSGDTATVP